MPQTLFDVIQFLCHYPSLRINDVSKSIFIIQHKGFESTSPPTEDTAINFRLLTARDQQQPFFGNFNLLLEGDVIFI